MSEPYLGEIRLMSFDFAPRGWASCDGQILPINQNQALYSLLGTTYGGDGRTTFALPDLRGRVPIHADDTYLLGQRSGAETHVLSTDELPGHTPTIRAVGGPGSTPVPGPTVALAATNDLYATPADLVPLAPDALGSVGGGQAHQNMAPFLTLTFAIALQGVFPPRN